MPSFLELIWLVGNVIESDLRLDLIGLASKTIGGDDRAGDQVLKDLIQELCRRRAIPVEACFTFENVALLKTRVYREFSQLLGDHQVRIMF